MKVLLFRLFLFFVSIFIICSCTKEYKDKPIFTLKKESPYLYKDVNLHISDTVIIGIVIKAIGQDNEIRRVKISKNELLLIDSMLFKQPVFFEFSMILDTLDTTLYTFFANDLSYNYKEYFIITTSFIDTSFDYDTTFDSIVKDSIIAIDSTQIIDTLIKINL